MTEIYLLDDTKGAAAQLHQLLLKAGCKATLFETPDDLLHCILVAPPDLVLAEVVSPRPGGVSLALRIRNVASGTKVMLFAVRPSFSYLWIPQQQDDESFRLLNWPITTSALLEDIRALINTSPLPKLVF